MCLMTVYTIEQVEAAKTIGVFTMRPGKMPRSAQVRES
ncbi:hypothetical protein PAMC26577_38155 [Caballeronia sordidicola]|uniref:Uncharacterized protein n=1 Tax=Caballeronia sordidicola TaxID=196367 RepID=A0A242M578_CABSO|nr:hypothetical protein PAMC26577_38155 [Caballeronia sordidicola]